MNPDDTARDALPPSAWTQHTADVPADSSTHALCVHPATGRATLLSQTQDFTDDGDLELWSWIDQRWHRTHARLSPARHGEARGTTVMLFTHSATRSLRVARVNPEGVLVVFDPDRPDDERRWTHPALPAHTTHAWAWEDARHRCVWMLLNESDAALFKLTDDALVEVSRGPYLLGATFDPVRGVIYARSVTSTSVTRIALPEGRHEMLDGPQPQLDALFFDPARDAVCAFEVTSVDRMECLTLGPDGWRRREPPLWAPTYRNGVAPLVDEATGVTLAHGGQDFDRSGIPTHETFFGREGEMADTHAPQLPRPWSSYGSLLTTEHGLLAVDHQSLRVLRREDAQWVPIGRVTIEGEAHANLDCRMTNVAWGDGALWVLDPDGRVLRWHPDGDASVTCAPPSKTPGAVYAHRVAMGWDPSTKSFAVFRGDRKRTLYRLTAGAWREDVLPDAPVAGIATALGTAAGLFVLSRNALHRLDGDTWVKAATATETQSYVLRHDPSRGALLAATQHGVFAWDGTAWRLVATLPAGVRLRTMGDGDAEFGVDPRADALVLLSGRGLWTLPLASLALQGCTLPTGAWKKSAVKKSAAKKSG